MESHEKIIERWMELIKKEEYETIKRIEELAGRYIDDNTQEPIKRQRTRKNIGLKKRKSTEKNEEKKTKDEPKELEKHNEVQKVNVIDITETETIEEQSKGITKLESNYKEITHENREIIVEKEKLDAIGSSEDKLKEESLEIIEVKQKNNKPKPVCDLIENTQKNRSENVEKKGVVGGIKNSKDSLCIQRTRIMENKAKIAMEQENTEDKETIVCAEKTQLEKSSLITNENKTKEDIKEKQNKLNAAFLKLKNTKPVKSSGYIDDPFRNKNLLKTSIRQNLLNSIKNSKFNANFYKPRMNIPTIDTDDEHSLELKFEVALWAKNPSLTNLVAAQSHTTLENMFKGEKVINLQEMFPDVENVTNDSPNKWDDD